MFWADTGLGVGRMFAMNMTRPALTFTSSGKIVAADATSIQVHATGNRELQWECDTSTSGSDPVRVMSPIWRPDQVAVATQSGQIVFYTLR